MLNYKSGAIAKIKKNIEKNTDNCQINGKIVKINFLKEGYDKDRATYDIVVKDKDNYYRLSAKFKGQESILVDGGEQQIFNKGDLKEKKEYKIIATPSDELFGDYKLLAINKEYLPNNIESIKTCEGNYNYERLKNDYTNYERSTYIIIILLLLLFISVFAIIKMIRTGKFNTKNKKLIKK